MPNVLPIALNYIRLGYPVIPLRDWDKQPAIANWQMVDISEANADAYFTEPRNIGVRLGTENSDHNILVDIDLDTPEAVILAPYFLPPTDAVFGRESKKKSHYLYYVAGRMASKPMAEHLGQMLLEIRSTGGQTMLPGSIHPSGEPVEWSTPDHTPALVDGTLLQSQAMALAAATLLARNWPAHNRHFRTLHLAGGLLMGGWELDKVEWFLQRICEAAGDGDFLDRREAARNTAHKIQIGEPVTGWTSLVEELDSATVRRLRQWLQINSSAAYARNDLGNAQRYIIANQDKVRYCPEQERWYSWNGSYWKLDVENRAHFLVRDAVEVIHDEQRASTGDAADALGKWYNASCNASHLAAMVKYAKDDPSVHIPNYMFDVDPWLLTCRNGTINLKTGGLQPANREDYITRTVATSYDPDAKSPTWELFIETITNGDRELQQFLQRLVGYMATGFTHEDKFSIAWGPTRTGKSTFVRAIEQVMGDYAGTARPEIFAPRNPDAIPNELAGMAGKRMVFTSELEANQKLAESLIKRLTGGDHITARFLYREIFQFRPQFKVWLATNDRPSLRGDDDAIWERVLLVPFTHQFRENERDLTFRDRLGTDNATAILAWIVEGVQQWRLMGLQPPETVQALASEYRGDMDTVTGFLDECTDTSDPESRTPAVLLYSAYRTWCQSRGERALQLGQFKTEIQRRGHESKRMSTGYVWSGISLHRNLEALTGMDSGGSIGFDASNPFGVPTVIR